MDAIETVASELTESIILNPDAYPRDKRETFETLVKLGDLAPSGRETAQPAPVASVTLPLTTAQARALIEALQPRVIIDGEARDSDDGAHPTTTPPTTD